MQSTDDLAIQDDGAPLQRSADLPDHVLKEGGWDENGSPRDWHINAPRQEMVMQLHADGGVDIHGVRHERLTAERRAAMGQPA